MVSLFFDVKSNVGNAFQHGLAHGLLDFEMVGARKGKEKVLIERHRQVTHTAAAFADPTAFGRGEDAFNGVVSTVAVGHRCMEEDEEVAVAIVLEMAQFHAEDITIDGVVNGDIETDAVLLRPFRLRDDGALVERSGGTSGQSQAHYNIN